MTSPGMESGRGAVSRTSGERDATQPRAQDQMAPSAPNATDPGRSGEAGRWRLHRGGIVNIWQYREQVFDFSGGRAVFQGTNGSGKSRTLELLLPLCLDGDLRQLGSKGFDTVSIRRLMLDDYDGGPNRIGYASGGMRPHGA